MISNFTFECARPHFRFSNELECGGSVESYQWDTSLMGRLFEPPDFSDLIISWGLCIDRTPFQYFCDFNQSDSVKLIDEQEPHVRISESSVIAWVFQKGYMHIALARPNGMGFDSFISAVIAGRLPLFVSLEMIFRTEEEKDFPTTAAFLKRSKPCFSQEPARFEVRQ
jgi:hypothetical protein